MHSIRRTRIEERTRTMLRRIRILFRGSLTERRGFGGEWNKFLFVKKKKRREHHFARATRTWLEINPINRWTPVYLVVCERSRSRQINATTLSLILFVSGTMCSKRWMRLASTCSLRGSCFLIQPFPFFLLSFIPIILFSRMLIEHLDLE